MSDELPSKINILTLNCWGLKFIAKYRRERLLEIGKRIASMPDPPHIVGLQECWTQEDYNNIREETREILPYGKFYFSGVFGGGLVILSKWPIESSHMLRYSLNGRPTAFFRGDWFVGKGVACANVRYGPGPKDIAAVFCTHLHAPYEQEHSDSYVCHRTSQAWEIMKLMRGAAEKGYLVIGLGDFNMVPLSLAHKLITSHAPVKDVWRELHPDSSIGAAKDKAEKARGKPVPTAEFNIKENGTTCDGPYNTWRWPKKEQKKLVHGPIETDGSVLDRNGKRLDYIFVGESPYSFEDTWKIEDVKLGMMERHPTLHCSLSDHFSVEATIVRNDSHRGALKKLPPQSLAMPSSRSRSVSPAVEGAVSPRTLNEDGSHRYIHTSRTTQTPEQAREMYDGILATIEKYVNRERFQRRFRVLNFFWGTLVAIGCLVAQWWVPRNYVAFILTLLGAQSLERI
ncbi:inositol phosphosphingolipids phospholipase C [Ascosphaera apis ARSEF 7405]|uniref:Inositol phosphosphingolipids phospholipase C n=1 Tax=Ascosphaera apis ARSEF 7405 TaxID=392613 RepID=A0A167Y0C6_9EURO|nr:inositol phosphosphingolipids phospholipase C [Ascosphaera apis ARSEF 7405]